MKTALSILKSLAAEYGCELHEVIAGLRNELDTICRSGHATHEERMAAIELFGAFYFESFEKKENPTHA